MNHEIETKTTAVQCGSMQHIKWPSIVEFNSSIGKEKIVKFMKTWCLGVEWKYYIPDIFKIEKKCSDYYVYTVRYSKPTSEYPIPQATVDVYFYIKVCRVLDPNTAVEVMFRLENSKKLYEPGKIHFKEIWLADVINTKIEFYKTLRF